MHEKTKKATCVRHVVTVKLWNVSFHRYGLFDYAFKIKCVKYLFANENNLLLDKWNKIK